MLESGKFATIAEMAKIAEPYLTARCDCRTRPQIWSKQFSTDVIRATRDNRNQRAFVTPGDKVGHGSGRMF